LSANGSGCGESFKAFVARDFEVRQIGKVNLIEEFLRNCHSLSPQSLILVIIGKNDSFYMSVGKICLQ
jgi:hypothetical protein